jgi:hypothetical protein
MVVIPRSPTNSSWPSRQRGFSASAISACTPCCAPVRSRRSAGAAGGGSSGRISRPRWNRRGSSPVSSRATRCRHGRATDLGQSAVVHGRLRLTLRELRAGIEQGLGRTEVHIANSPSWMVRPSSSSLRSEGTRTPTHCVSVFTAALRGLITLLSMWPALYGRRWAAGLPVLGRGPSAQAGSSPGAKERRGGSRTPDRSGRPMAAFE